MSLIGKNAMETVQIQDKSPFANPAFSEVHRAIPYAAELLGVEIEDVKILDGWSFPTFHMSTDYADHPMKAVGLHEDFPFIQTSSLHNKHGSAGYGMTLFECRNARHLKYLWYQTKDHRGYADTYVICKKGDLWKIYRNCKRMEKLAQKNEPPILKEGLLDQVIQTSIHFLMNSKEVERYGVRIKRGLLLDGPPGNGKTMACRYIQRLCTDNNIDWGIVNASDIDRAYHDNEMDRLFNRHTVTFFDDIDISYLSRKEGAGKVACSILTAMDGMSEGHHVVRIFTTNEKVDDLDKAFTRPGRIDRRFTFDKPSAKLRRKLLEIWPEEIIEGIGCDEGKDYIVNNTKDFSFAELEAIRANLVTNFLFGDKTWDVEKAFDAYHNGAGTFRPVSLGFNNRREDDEDECYPSPPREVAKA